MARSSSCYNDCVLQSLEESAHELFRREMMCFEKRKADLLDRAEGQYVLIKGDELLGIFSSQKEAVKEGYRRLGNVPFLVKLIVDEEQPITITSLP